MDYTVLEQGACKYGLDRVLETAQAIDPGNEDIPLLQFLDA
jgi:hypothetical protein